MPDNADKPHPWRPRIRLWQVFALVTLSAVLVWMWPRLGLELNHQPGQGSRAAIVWNGEAVEIWNTWPPPATVTVAIQGPNGPVNTLLPQGTKLPADAMITGTEEFKMHGPNGTTTTLTLPVVTRRSSEP